MSTLHKNALRVLRSFLTKRVELFPSTTTLLCLAKFVERVKSIKFLEVTITNNLSWISHGCKKLQKVVCTAQTITEANLPSMDSIYVARCHGKAVNIIKDPLHPGQRGCHGYWIGSSYACLFVGNSKRVPLVLTKHPTSIHIQKIISCHFRHLQRDATTRHTLPSPPLSNCHRDSLLQDTLHSSKAQSKLEEQHLIFRLGTLQPSGLN
eukprot:g38249.t1